MTLIEDSVLSLHERVCLVRSLTGFPHPITFLFTYPSLPILPSRQRLILRAEALQTLWPHMYVRVGAAKTNRPVWTRRERTGPWSGDRVVVDAAIPVKISSLTSTASQQEALIHYDLQSFIETQSEPTGAEPLFRITRYLPSEHGDQAAYLAISINHFVADGVGASRIAMAILADNIDHLTQDIGHPPRLEDTVDIVPPSPPAASSTSLWPGRIVNGPPTTFPQGLSLLQLDRRLVSRLVTASRERGLVKLHAVLEAAWVLALQDVLGNEWRDDWSVLTPINERSASPGDVQGLHPYAIGDYASRVITMFSTTTLQSIVSELSKEKTNPDANAFWNLAGRVASEIAAPDKRQSGRYTMGALAFLPNQPTLPNEPTAWETQFLAQSRSEKPYPNSSIISNLTFIPLTAGASDMAWTQPACPFSAVFMTSVLGHEDGVRWCTTWREGCVVVKEQVKAVEVAFVRLLNVVAA